MKKFLFTLSIFLIVFNSNAQIIFQKTLAGTGFNAGYSIQQTSDGGYILVGNTNSFGAGDYDVFLIKLNNMGDTLWTKTFGGADIDVGYSVQQTTDGGYIITGGTSSFGVGTANVYLIKTDANGDSLWTKTIGGLIQYGGKSVQQTTDGGYIITGGTSSILPASNSVYLVKTNSNGDVLWANAFHGISSSTAYSVQQTAEGGYITAGSRWVNMVHKQDGYIVKTDDAGNLHWTKTFGGTSTEEANSVRQTADGGYIIAGYTYSFGAGNFDVYLVKTDVNGDTLWTKTYGGAGYDVANSVQQTADGGYIIAGDGGFGPGGFDVYLIKIDSVGIIMWTQTFGGPFDEHGYSVQQTDDGGYIVTGLTKVSGGLNVPYNVYVIKTDANGNSGCMQANPATIVSASATTLANSNIIIDSGGTVTVPSTIIGNAGFTDIPCTVSINEIEHENRFHIFPDPSSGKLTTSFERTITKGTVEVLNILGENVLTENIFNQSRKEINIKNIFSGIYFVKVFDGEKSYCKKLIIE